MPTSEERFWAKVMILSPDECWEWQAGKDDEGYGRFQKVGAHVFSYMLHKGAVPKGWVVDHLCTNPPCVNPLHLEAVTRSINAQRWGYLKRTDPNFFSKTQAYQRAVLEQGRKRS